MLQRFLGITVSVLFPLLASGCNGGGVEGTAVGNQACGEAGAFCLVSCNLGCGSLTCDITDIAVNSRLQFTFNQPLDPTSVGFDTISLRTATGIEPSGDFIVSGQTVTFFPSVRNIEGQTFFGFEPNATYTLALLGGSGPNLALTSTSGERLQDTYECTLRVTQGIVDTNPGGPDSSVLSPSVTNNVPRDATFVIEFDELVDEAAFAGTTPVDGPIQVSLRTTSEQNGERVCNLTGSAFAVPGGFALNSNSVLDSTTWSFTPNEDLPSSSCLEISITSQVRDLAGNAAVPRVFRFITASSSGAAEAIEESFDSSAQLDVGRSSGTWTGGFGSFARVGGDGRHGDFRIEDGAPGGSPDTFTFRTDSFTLSDKPSARTATVTGGEFHFTSFVVPADQTVRFIGPNPARIFVSGAINIQGTVDLSAPAVPGDFDGANSTVSGGTVTQVGAGQPGGEAGPGGGRGGDGAFACDGTGNPTNPMFNDFAGFDGEDVNVPSNHLGAGDVMGTGGRGGALRPAHGDTSMLMPVMTPTLPIADAVHVDVSPRPGGGGGFQSSGVAGVVLRDAAVVSGQSQYDQNAPLFPTPLTTAGGDALDLFGYPFTDAVTHFVVGGSGGGGGGSGAIFAADDDIGAMSNVPVWWSGRAGGGGGGALLLQTGDSFSLGGTIRARGGSIVNPPQIARSLSLSDSHAVTASFRGAPAPGGGGSGGSVLIQIDGNVDFSPNSLLDVSGGDGNGLGIFTPPLFYSDLRSGDGGDGVFRLEAPGTLTPNAFGQTAPAAVANNIGPLQTTNDRVLVQSLFYGTGSPFPAAWDRYELDIEVDGVPMTFTDADLASAAVEGSPVQVFFQGANIDLATGEPTVDPVTGQPVGLSPWLRFVSSAGTMLNPPQPGLSAQSANGFRFQILVDRAAAGTSNVRVDALRVFFVE